MKGKRGNGTLIELEHPLAFVKQRLQSYKALMDRNRLMDVYEDDMHKFRDLSNEVYHLLSEEEQEIRDQIWDKWMAGCRKYKIV